MQGSSKQDSWRQTPQGVRIRVVKASRFNGERAGAAFISTSPRNQSAPLDMKGKAEMVTNESPKVTVLRVSTKSDPKSVAGAITGYVREQGKVELSTIGAGALNQAIKALAIARGFMAPSGVDLICRPAFSALIVEGGERTAIRLMVEPR